MSSEEVNSTIVDSMEGMEIDSSIKKKVSFDEKEQDSLIDQLDSMFTEKKKKKKKAPQPNTLETEQTQQPDQQADQQPLDEGADDNILEDLNDFTQLKKKKKDKKKVFVEEELDELQEPNEDYPTIADEEEGGEIDLESWQNNDKDYTYQELLSRVFRIIRQNNPDFVGDKKLYKMIPPQVAREGSKKTVFSNINDICRKMHRQPEHLISFIYAELGTTGAVDGSGQLVIKGRFQQKQIEMVLKRYILEYVTCKTCKSPETVLNKENRLFFLQCETCGSSRAVTAIKSGFRAQIGKRRLNQA